MRTGQAMEVERAEGWEGKTRETTKIRIRRGPKKREVKWPPRTRANKREGRLK